MTSTFVTINPFTEEEIAEHERMDQKAAEEAVVNCHEAFRHWRRESLENRAKVIASIGEKLRERKDELAELMTREMGKLLSQSRDEVELCAAICDWTAKNGPEELASYETELPMGNGRGKIVYSPLGVIYGIQPWNYPAYQVIRYSIANLMAGNGVLLKHASNVTGSGKLLADIYREAGLPENLFTVLVIDHDLSDRIIEHELIRGVTLTGSSAAGAHVAEKAGAALKKTVLELGSNDAYIVLGDADIKKAVQVCTQGRIYNNGETCIAAKRFIVVDEIFEAFRDAFVDAMDGLEAGDPTHGHVDMGPMAREDLRNDLHEQVRKSVDGGAKIACGGEIPNKTGFFYPGTVLENVKPGQPAYDDELFGPVASLIRAKDEDAAMGIANDSRFGLGGGIISGDTEHAVELAAEYFDTGMVFINGFGLALPNMPFGGVKDSGYGREHGGFGMKEFVNAKAIHIKG